MNARPRWARGPWPRALMVVLATFALVLGAAAAAAAPGHPSASRTASTTRTVRTASTARTASAASCNPFASSLSPSGPPQVTAGSYMAKIRARGYLIAGVDQSTYHFGFLNPLTGRIEGFDIDMIRAVAQAIFGNPDKVVYKAISDDSGSPTSPPAPWTSWRTR